MAYRCRQRSVSIHAPARGATERCHDHAGAADVSIHAPARGATTASVAGQLLRLRCFNPRARAGRDNVIARTMRWTKCFNPRARAGRDLAMPASVPSQSLFQSTRPRGARRVLGDAASLCRFNPRARAGRDDLPPLLQRPCVSIHAPARGATWYWRGYLRCSQFQSTRPRGARRARDSQLTASDDVSIHAPARGATACWSCATCALVVSIHAPARGATMILRRRTASRCFNPRARAGRDLHSHVAIECARCALFQSTRPRGARRFHRN